MNRLEKLRIVVDEILMTQEDIEERRCGYVHLYGVSAQCTILALKRGLNPEIASTAGMLHDIYTYRTKIIPHHAHNSEEDARVILRDLGEFTVDEQSIIRNAIFNHSDKHLIHQPYDELLKDADVLQHYLYNPKISLKPVAIQRLQRVLSELTITAAEIVQMEAETNMEEWKALEPQTEKPLKPALNENRRARLADFAETLAQKPLTGDENKSGADVFPLIRYFPGAELTNGFDWCAAFVYHCCMQVGFVLPIRYPDPAVSCRFAGVRAWLEWAKLPKNQFFHSIEDTGFTPVRGDIVIFDNLVPNGPHDHIGIVLGYEQGVLTTAEGNVDNRSGIFTRQMCTNINGFVRIDDTYKYSYTRPESTEDQ